MFSPASLTKVTITDLSAMSGLVVRNTRGEGGVWSPQNYIGHVTNTDCLKLNESGKNTMMICFSFFTLFVQKHSVK